METLLKSEKLCYNYDGGGKALDGVDFSVSKGESVALIGANGAGKSTLLQLIVGILTPLSGGIFFNGEPVAKKSLPLIREKIGLVFQNPEHQLFCGSVYEDVVFGPLNFGLSRQEADARAEEVLSELGISHLRERPPYRLSAGEKRMSAIASVLSMKPELLLMDEPTAELDPRARRELITLLNRLPQTKIIATHDLDFAAKTCASAMILHSGRVAASGGAGKLLSDEKLLISLGL